MPLGRSRPGDGRSSGKIMGLALLPVVFLAWTQPPPQGCYWQGAHPQLWAPTPPSAPQGPCPTRGCEDLTPTSAA